MGGEDRQNSKVMDLPLSRNVSGPIELVHLERSSLEDFWNISFQLMKIDDAIVITVSQINIRGKDNVHNSETSVALQANDIVISINGSKVGYDGLKTLRCVLLRFKQEVDL